MRTFRCSIFIPTFFLPLPGTTEQRGAPGKPLPRIRQPNKRGGRRHKPGRSAAPQEQPGPVHLRSGTPQGTGLTAGAQADQSETREQDSAGHRLSHGTERCNPLFFIDFCCHGSFLVFINCSGFVKIDTNSLGDSTEAYVEILDGSRVHPETYEWARKMAVDALEYDDDEGANPAGALEEILEAPERLKDLDLDAFAEELERQGFGKCIAPFSEKILLRYFILIAVKQKDIMY